MSGLQEYHEVWLRFHPNRSVEWLRERMKDGFAIHHIDGDHSNNSIENLILIEYADHLAIHSGMKTRIGLKPKAPKKRVLATVTDVVVHKSLEQGIRHSCQPFESRMSCHRVSGVVVTKFSTSSRMKSISRIVSNRCVVMAKKPSVTALVPEKPKPCYDMDVMCDYCGKAVKGRKVVTRVGGLDAGTIKIFLEPHSLPSGQRCLRSSKQLQKSKRSSFVEK